MVNCAVIQTSVLTRFFLTCQMFFWLIYIVWIADTGEHCSYFWDGVLIAILNEVVNLSNNVEKRQIEISSIVQKAPEELLYRQDWECWKRKLPIIKIRKQNSQADPQQRHLCNDLSWLWNVSDDAENWGAVFNITGEKVNKKTNQGKEMRWYHDANGQQK